MAEPKVRVFVSSPSDLEHERALTKDIIEALGQEYLPYFKVQAILWEQEALTAARADTSVGMRDRAGHALDAAGNAAGG